MKTAAFVFFILAANALFAQNILISNQNNPNETAIMMDPVHPNVLIAGANMDNYYVSNDTGRTWSKHTLTSTYGVWGDPVIAVDTAGSFYFFHLSNPSFGSWIDRIVCQKTTNNGSTWSNGSFTGLNGTKDQDKPWCAVDRKSNNLYITWTQFDKYASTVAGDSSNILFSKSTDAGLTWTTPKRINVVAGDCRDDDNTVEGAVPAIGPNGEIYVSWASPDGIVFNTSADQGVTWLSRETPVNNMPGGWNFDVPGMDRCNGLPVTTCDISSGPYRGTIYINWSDQRNGTSNTDIWLSKSSDGGTTWSAPIKVNDDNSNRHQFFTWMTIDQTTGYLYFVFYDRRNYSGNSTDVYVAISTDGGTTFINHKISETPFLPNSSIFFGDYTNIVAHNGIVRPIWTRLNNGQLSIWTDIKDYNTPVHSPAQQTENPGHNISFENYPNPTENDIFVSYKLHTTAIVSLIVCDTSGNVISKIIDNDKRNYGNYVERINLKELTIASGIYLLRLTINGKIDTVRQIIIK